MGMRGEHAGKAQTDLGSKTGLPTSQAVQTKVVNIPEAQVLFVKCR